MPRKRIRVEGIVQGVGFRPFVYRLANKLVLSGFVRNTTEGVDIEIEGSQNRIRLFLKRLKYDKPAAARIDEVRSVYVKVRGSKRFSIRKSRIADGITQLSPDIATCQQCLKEVYDFRDRRFGYPFINCTNCGPRYSIIINTPYDRARTTMKTFRMCRTCRDEFQDIHDRRFHAQPDCCGNCGPSLTLYSISGQKISERNSVEKTVQLLKKGKIVAIKGIGGFHLACDATDSTVVRKLRKHKKRPTKPFAIMARLRDAATIAYIRDDERTVYNSAVAPILLLRKRPKSRIIAEEVSPESIYHGVMAPYTPLHYFLLDRVPYLVMTSANVKDEPIVTDDAQVERKLKRIASHYLSHDRKIENRCDDSVGFILPNRGFSIIRRSRGYAPTPVKLPFTIQPTLAVGPYLKNTFTLAHKDEAYVSPYIGDLDNLETLEYFNEMVTKYKRWFKIKPRLIVHDAHPDYLSTKIAKSMEGVKIPVYHHVAHVVSCLAENQIFDDAIGVAFDGTGYGEDGNIWGGEFFLGNVTHQTRMAHLVYLPLPGGEVSIQKPYRTALAYLNTLLGIDTTCIPEGVLPFSITDEERQSIAALLKRKRNVVYTSSMGRLFDCVAALLGLRKEITYEAEAAINLEHAAAPKVRTSYGFKITGKCPFIIDVHDTLAGIVRDIKNRINTGVISAKFHNTVVSFSLDIIKKLSTINRVNKVCLSGGVFQNRFLLTSMIDTLEHNGFKVYVHRKLPTNDSCISYGQVVYGNTAVHGIQ